MMNIIEIKIRDCYGKQRAFPSNCEAEVFCTLLNQRTLTRTNLMYIQELGYDIKVVGNGDSWDCVE